MTHVIGVDLGGTKTSAAVVGSDGSVLLDDQIQTPNADGGMAILNATGELISRLREQATVLGVDRRHRWGR
jgi:glucokinase